jgi:RNA polymerase sigma-70 factor (ECF subfamily)
VEGRPLDDESELIERAKRGDEDAVEVLVQRYQEVAFRVAYLICGNPDEARDAAQSAFIKAYYALPGFRAGAPLRPWLLRIVANEARNRRTAALRHPTLALGTAIDRPSNDAAPSPEAAALAAERRRIVLAAVDDLRGDERLVVAYRYFLDLSEAEMAEALSIPRGTVKSRLSRALTRLRARLTEADESDERGQTSG